MSAQFQDFHLRNLRFFIEEPLGETMHVFIFGSFCGAFIYSFPSGPFFALILFVFPFQLGHNSTSGSRRTSNGEAEAYKVERLTLTSIQNRLKYGHASWSGISSSTDLEDSQVDSIEGLS